MKNLLHKLLNFIVLITFVPFMFVAMFLIWIIVSVALFVESFFVFDADGRD